MLLVTGSSGYLGTCILRAFHSTAFGIGRSMAKPYNVNLKEKFQIKDEVTGVIHCAGKAHVVPRTFSDVLDFYRVNYTGTLNLLRALEAHRGTMKYFVFISTAAVYGEENVVNTAENGRLNANSAYGRSKLLAEKEIQEWCRMHHIPCLILRLPLVVGSNPPGNLGQMIRAINKGFYFNIERGKARRSMVMRTDVVRFIQKFHGVDGVYNLTDGYNPSYFELSNYIASKLGKKAPRQMPLFFLKPLAWVGDIFKFFPLNSYKLKKLNADFTITSDKALAELNWIPTPILDDLEEWVN